MWYFQTRIVICRQIKVGHVSKPFVESIVYQIKCSNLNMVWFDLLNIIQHKFLVVLCVILIRKQATDSVLNINQAGFNQPARSREFTENKVKHQRQATITFNQQVINKQFFIDGLYNFTCLNHRFLIIVLCIKHFKIKTKAA